MWDVAGAATFSHILREIVRKKEFYINVTDFQMLLINL